MLPLLNLHPPLPSLEYKKHTIVRSFPMFNPSSSDSSSRSSSHSSSSCPQRLPAPFPVSSSPLLFLFLFIPSPAPPPLSSEEELKIELSQQRDATSVQKCSPLISLHAGVIRSVLLWYLHAGDVKSPTKTLIKYAFDHAAWKHYAIHWILYLTLYYILLYNF